MIHLFVNRNFTYLNYLTVMSAILGNKVKIWVMEEPQDNKYWNIVKKVKSIDFVTCESPSRIESGVFMWTLDAIFLGKLGYNYEHEYQIRHSELYFMEEIGEFEVKDMTLVRVHPVEGEVLSSRFIETSGTLLSALVKRVLLERVWKQ